MNEATAKCHHDSQIAKRDSHFHFGPAEFEAATTIDPLRVTTPRSRMRSVYGLQLIIVMQKVHKFNGCDNIRLRLVSTERLHAQ